MNTFTRFATTSILGLLLSACETPKSTETQGNQVLAKTMESPKSSSDTSRAATSKSAPAAAPVVSPASAKALETAPAIAVAEVPARPKPEQLLTEGTESYNKGDYKGAIRKLQMASETSEPNSGTKLSSLKLLAFSYCVTNQRPQCAAQFTSLLKISPAFQLTRAEAGHPLWGPVFKEAKDASAPKPKKKA
jgi:hypothetical protein